MAPWGNRVASESIAGVENSLGGRRVPVPGRRVPLPDRAEIPAAETAEAARASQPTNTEIAAALDELGDLYELDGAIVHRIVAYRNAAKAVREAPVSVAALARRGRATELAGIGRTIQEKVLALSSEGAIPAAVKLRAKFAPGLIEITRLPG